MNSLQYLSKNEDGFVLITAMVMLVILTLLGTFALNTTTFELQIAGNDRSHKEAFYSADSGIYAAAKVISQAVDEQAVPSLAAFSFPDTDFYDELAGFSPYDAAADITFSLGNTNPVQVDVRRGDAVNVAGGGREFASGVEGGGTGGVGIKFDLDSFGTAANSSKSNIGAQYLKMVGTAGGL